MTQRAQVAKSHGIPIFHDGTATFTITDTVTGEVLCQHRFFQPDGKHPRADEYIAAERAVAQAIADALNAGGDGAIRRVVQAREAVSEAFKEETATRKAS